MSIIPACGDNAGARRLSFPRPNLWNWVSAGENDCVGCHGFYPFGLYGSGSLLGSGNDGVYTLESCLNGSRSTFAVGDLH